MKFVIVFMMGWACEYLSLLSFIIDFDEPSFLSYVYFLLIISSTLFCFFSELRANPCSKCITCCFFDVEGSYFKTKVF